ncbi:hypothetical protein G6O69_37635 [Pseudenhygromyxa sp. WMMC2535]|uniref:hypothetical protein n=1 Tax=Pseudenhygromyxa sp. WMMC2535 TaxID=2712867 RepID=UPI001556CECC|nr:hypothetical protein [Pseudenhygromyxa sp. WMMC2535]NVB38237.1 hypothetical protein [Pseudenhygromyxa sp. WMMC2535]NVB43594.1 hypothetical protein [Pseudenhygromyxa sp. WMMC2535]
MDNEKAEYNGASLSSFILALGHSRSVTQKILADVGVDRIDPERWYDFDWAMNIYDKIAAEVGRGALIEVGRKIIEAAAYPPELDSVQSVLMALDDAYRLNVRGPVPGRIVCTLEDDYSATLDWSLLGPCALNIGIIEGSCARFGAKALIEHGGEGCMDEGAAACVYHVSW